MCKSKTVEIRHSVVDLKMTIAFSEMLTLKKWRSASHWLASYLVILLCFIVVNLIICIPSVKKKKNLLLNASKASKNFNRNTFGWTKITIRLSSLRVRYLVNIWKTRPPLQSFNRKSPRTFDTKGLCSHTHSIRIPTPGEHWIPWV